jgi:RHS repeat-associated protein
MRERGLLLRCAKSYNDEQVPAAKEITDSLGEMLPQMKTRVWGVPPENQTGIGESGPAISTLDWGCEHFYAGTASASLVQRWYGPGTGRFATADPYMASGGGSGNPANPMSWNRYAYVLGDPVNLWDTSGMYELQPPTYVEGGALEGDNTKGSDNKSSAAGGTSSNPFNMLQGFGSALSTAVAALSKPECRSLFGSGLNPAAFLTSMAFATTSSSIVENNLPSDRLAETRFSNPVGKEHEVFWATATIVIDNAKWAPINTVDQAGTLIHELGHVFQFLAGSGGSKFWYDANPDGTPNDAAEKHNSEIIKQNCLN